MVLLDRGTAVNIALLEKTPILTLSHTGGGLMLATYTLDKRFIYLYGFMELIYADPFVNSVCL